MQTGVIVTLMHELQLVPDIGNIILIMCVPYTATTNIKPALVDVSLGQSTACVARPLDL